MKARFWVVCAVVLIAPSASANGAMGLGLEMFDLTYWFAYVVVIIALEAWLIGRYVKATTFSSIVTAIIANLLTGVFCGGLGCIAPFLHYPIIGTLDNPRPFPNAIALLTLFAIPSGLMEMILWERAALVKNNFKNYRYIVLIHLLTVPVGLGVLLIPERPYRGLEAFTMGARRQSLRDAETALTVYISEHGRLPLGNSPKEILRELYRFDPDLKESDWYAPQFSRFSLGESFEHPFEMNPRLVGLRFTEYVAGPDENWVWYMRYRSSGGHGFGLRVDVNSGQVQKSFVANDLDFGK